MADGPRARVLCAVAAGLFGVGALVLGACGGTEKLSAEQARTFSREFQPVNADTLAFQQRYLVDALTSIGRPDPRVRVRPDARLARRLDGYRREMSAIDRRARRLRPPAALRDDTKKLIGLMDAIERDFANAASAVRQRDAAAAQNAGVNLVGHSAGLGKVRTGIEHELRAAMSS